MNDVHEEIALGKIVHEELGLPIPNSFKDAEEHYRNHDSCLRAKAEFHRQYKPIKYLAENVSYHTARKLFAEMGQWYQKLFFPEGLSEGKEVEHAELLGADFCTTFERKNAAVLLWLEAQGIIH